jgi:2-dehydro-3-deoxygluconokinase
MHDLVTLGEVLLRLAVPSPACMETVRRLDVQIGGAEANVAATAARLGLRTAWISALPANGWGERVRRELVGHGVDCSHVRIVEGARLGLYFLEYGVPPRPIRVLYDRRESAFAQLRPEDVDWEPVRQARIVHLTGITPALSATARKLSERALHDAATVSLDVNFRAALWSPTEACAWLQMALPAVRYLFIGLDEARLVFGFDEGPERVLERLAQLAPRSTVTLLMGEGGSLTLDSGRLVRPSLVPPAQIVDPIGAGDAYVAGFLWATMRGADLNTTVDTAAAVAALKCSMWGDIALINQGDVEEVLLGGPRVRR